jgi:hypothetical protein
MKDMNDTQLLQASRRGDVQAFGEIVKRYQSSVSGGVGSVACC